MVLQEYQLPHLRVIHLLLSLYHSLLTALDLLRDRKTRQWDCGMALQEYQSPHLRVTQGGLRLYHSLLTALDLCLARGAAGWDCGTVLREHQLTSSTATHTLFIQVFHHPHLSTLSLLWSRQIQFSEIRTVKHMALSVPGLPRVCRAQSYLCQYAIPPGATVEIRTSFTFCSTNIYSHSFISFYIRLLTPLSRDIIWIILLLWSHLLTRSWDVGTRLAALSLPQGLSLPVVDYIISCSCSFPLPSPSNVC